MIRDIERGGGIPLFPSVGSDEWVRAKGCGRKNILGGMQRLAAEARFNVKSKGTSKSKVKGSGQECPLHTSRSRFLTGLDARFGMTES